MRTGRKQADAPEGISGQTLAELKSAGLWFLEVLISAIFGLSGVLKVSKPVEYLSGLGMDSMIALPEWAVRTLGTVELLSAGGLLVPAMLGVLVTLAPLAIIMLLAIQAFAIILELLVAHDSYVLTMNIVLLGCLAVAAWHRFQTVR